MASHHPGMPSELLIADTTRSSSAARRTDSRKKSLVSFTILTTHSLTASSKYGQGSSTEFMDLPERLHCSQELYESLQKWLLEEYIIEDGSKNAGQRLNCNVVMQAISSLINQAATKHKISSNDGTKLFFTCLDPKSTTESALWLQCLRTTTIKESFQRNLAAGSTTQDNSAPPWYIEHVRAMVNHTFDYT